VIDVTRLSVASYLGRRDVSCHSDQDRLVREYQSADGNAGGDDAVDPLGELVLGGFRVADGVLGDGDVGGPPADERLPPWASV
jgi:hypothetical protein